jgi:CDP-6-deoxy-D-xylo-4-hexulose-3-dehydrase
MDQAVSTPALRSISLVHSTFRNPRATQRELAAFVQRAARLTMGEECMRFEAAFAHWQGRSHAVLVSSGSTANLILVQALLNLGRLQRGDRVAVSALTWATSVMPLLQLGLVPVPVDCETRHLNVSSRTLLPHLSAVRAVFLTHVLGFCGDVHRIADLCRQRGIFLLEDACEALGSVVGGTKLGNLGVASTFSFYVAHQLSTIEGGMVCTDDDELWEQLLLVRSHGWDRNVSPAARQRLREEHTIDDFEGLFTFYDLGYNARPTEITGFLGNVQLPFLDAAVAARDRNFRRFSATLVDCAEHCHDLDLSHMDTVSNLTMPVLCRDARRRQRVLRVYEDAGVEVRPVVSGDVTQQPFFRKHAAAAPCPSANAAGEGGFCFPNHPELTEDEVDFLCALLRNALGRS